MIDKHDNEVLQIQLDSTFSFADISLVENKTNTLILIGSDIIAQVKGITGLSDSDFV